MSDKTEILGEFISMGQSSIMDDNKEYIGWSYIEYDGSYNVKFTAVDNIESYANPRITRIFEYTFSKKMVVKPLELFMIYFNSGFYTHYELNRSKIRAFAKACEKYCIELDESLKKI
jgi:hypothetical protein